MLLYCILVNVFLICCVGNRGINTTSLGVIQMGGSQLSVTTTHNSEAIQQGSCHLSHSYTHPPH